MKEWGRKGRKKKKGIGQKWKEVKNGKGKRERRKELKDKNGKKLKSGEGKKERREIKDKKWK